MSFLGSTQAKAYSELMGVMGCICFTKLWGEVTEVGIEKTLQCVCFTEVRSDVADLTLPHFLF